MITPMEAGEGPGVIRIQAPRTERRDDWVRVIFPVDGIEPSELWFDVDAAHQHFVTESCDSAVAALLIAAMAVGKPLIIQGPISPKLLWNIHNTVIPVALRQLPFLHPIRVFAEEGMEGDGRSGSAILTGFSCGVDSFSAIQDHLLSETISDRDRVTHLLFSHIGHHGYGGDIDTRVAERWERVRKASGELGLPIVRVYSNTPEFYPQEYDSQLKWAAALTLRNSAVPLLLQSGVRRFLFASSHAWRDIHVGPTRDMTFADPILLPVMGTERTRALCRGNRIHPSRKDSGNRRHAPGPEVPGRLHHGGRHEQLLEVREMSSHHSDLRSPRSSG